MDNDLVKVVFSAFALMILLVAEQGYRDYLWERTLIDVPQMQQNSSTGAQEFWKLFSNAGLGLVSSVPIAVPYLYVSERSRCFYFVLATIGIQALTSILKLAYHGPRPFWVSPDIQAFDCSNQYGNPSGHCFTTLGMVLVCWLDFNSWVQHRP